MTMPGQSDSFAFTKTTAPRPRPADDKLGFGQIFADHMFVMEWTVKGGWQNGRIVPYGPLCFEPAAAVFHYGQALFDGFKAFRSQSGGVAGDDSAIKVFRIDRHCNRILDGAKRLCMPAPDPALVAKAVRELVSVDASWVPSAPGTALYLRPTLIATEPFLGVRPAERCTFFIISCPVGAYYAEGIHPVAIAVEREQVRAARGGLGAVKAGANYAASLYAAHQAKQRGFAQVLWLDATEHRYIEEVGTMNVLVHIGDEVITPPLGGSILPGVTRDSVLTLLSDWGLRGVERAISIDEVVAAQAAGTLKEMFGCGTAAVISPIGELGVDGKRLTVGSGKTGPMAERLYQELTGIQYGTRPDVHGWMTPVAP